MNEWWWVGGRSHSKTMPSFFQSHKFGFKVLLGISPTTMCIDMQQKQKMCDARMFLVNLERQPNK